MSSKADKARKAMLKARDAHNSAWCRQTAAQEHFRNTQREFLFACGWEEEARFDGRFAKTHAYRLSSNKDRKWGWHTLSGALEKQRERERRAARRKAAK